MKLIDENNCTYLNDKPKRKLVIYCTVFALLLLYFVPTFIYVAKETLSDIGKEMSPEVGSARTFKAPMDARIRYVEGYYLLKGINPNDVITQKVVFDKYILRGAIIPTGLALHAIIMPAYLPPKFAIWIYMGVLAVAMGISCFLIYKFVDQRAGKFLAALCAFLYISQKYSFISFFITGNYCILVFAVILAMCLTNFFEKHPVIGGIIMGIAMVKAQMMVLLFLPFLLQKRYLTILCAVATFLLMLIVVAYQVDTPPLRLIQEYLALGDSNRLYLNKSVYFGVFRDVAQVIYGFDLEKIKPIVKIGSLIFFLISAGIAYRYRNANKLLLYTALILISTIWGYNFTYNTLPIAYILMAIPIVISLSKSEKITYAKYGIYGLFFFVMIPFNAISHFGITDAMAYIPHRYLIERLHLFATFAYMLYDCKKNNLWGYLTVKTQD